ncbi:MAG: hypothetical protein ABI707_16330 [Ferruginibacter sp.]
MKISNLVLLTSIAAVGFINASAQTPDEIINKWTAAMGGKDKLATIKTIYTEDELSIMNNPAPHKSYLVNGKGFKSETDFNGQLIIDCYTVDSGWSINPFTGMITATNMPASQVKVGQLQLDPAGPLYNYAAKGIKIELLGKENVNEAASYKLKLTTSAGVEINYFIDSVTYYIVKEVTKMNADGHDIEITKLNSDFRKTSDGFVMPFTQELSYPGLALTITCKKVEFNKEIDPGIFEKPKK